MTGKNILSLILAIIVGIVAFWIIKLIVKIAIGIGLWLMAGAVIGIVAFLAYRKFNNMLSSGKRLT